VVSAAANPGPARDLEKFPEKQFVFTDFLLTGMKFFTQFAKFLADIFRNRGLIFTLAKRDFKTRYIGSYLGFLWAFIQPVVTILLLILVFKMGFKVKLLEGKFDFELWLITGLIPWFFFTEALSSATNSILEHSYLVQKVVFRVSLLPIVKIVTATIVHFFFIIFIFLVFAVYGYRPSLYNLQVVYYFFCALVLLLGLTWASSALVIFFKDTTQFIQMLIQFGFWLTPLIWSIRDNSWPSSLKFIIRLNPVSYITEGYRDSFVYHAWFWEHWKQGIYFWILTLVIFFAGAVIFRKLRPHFADVI
jgi:lipopolysaccharide transport system permease protein/teichoic acid transport system permease protein